MTQARSWSLAASACIASIFATLPAQATIIFASDTSAELIGTFSYTGNGAYETKLPSNFELLPFPSGMDYLFGIRDTAVRDIEGFGTNEGAKPNSPHTSNLPIPAVFTAYSEIGGYYTTSNLPINGTPVYFLLSNLQDTGGPEGTFSGDFCFSTNATTCAASTTPEPATLTLLGLGLAGLAASRRRKQ